MLDRQLAIVGPGLLGSQVLDLVARESPGTITLVGRDEEKVRRRANLAAFAADHLGVAVDVRTATTDVSDVEATAELLQALAPDVVFAAMTSQPYWMVGELPRSVAGRLELAGMGAWLPHQLAPIHQLMTAVRLSGVRSSVINAALPDITHPVLATVGLSPLAGVGNVANSVPALRRAAAHLLGCPAATVEIRLVAEAYVSHRLPRHGDAGGAPFHLGVRRDGVDVTGQLDLGRLLRLVATDFGRSTGPVSVMLSAAAAAAVVLAALGRPAGTLHGPGPGGLVGGYPLRVTPDRVQVLLPDGVGLEQAVRANTEAMAYDGVREIRPDGTVVFSDIAAEVLQDVLGYDARPLPLAECADRATELAARMRELRARLGLHAGG